jgi:hypothetical protein
MRQRKTPRRLAGRPGLWLDWLESNVRELTCSVDGCEGVKPKIKLGMCGKHYQRFTKYGSTDVPAKVYGMCDGPECSRRSGSSGLCPSHYQQRYLGKELTPLLVATSNLGRPAFCVFPGCGRPHKARGLCKAHRDQVAKGQDPRAIKLYNPGAICVEPGCDREVVARGLCAKDLVYSYEVVKRYGLTLDRYDAMREAQGDTCAICRGVNANGYRLSIDHDHKCCPGSGSCGRCVRALLCAKCNFAIGHAGDEPQRLRDAADYLEAHATNGRLAV